MIHGPTVRIIDLAFVSGLPNVLPPKRVQVVTRQTV